MNRSWSKERHITQRWSEETYADINSKVGRHFRVYDEKRGERSILLYISADLDSIELKLSLLRDDLKPDYRAFFTRSGGEEGIMVVDTGAVSVKPKLWLHALLFGITVMTTGIAGSMRYYDFMGVPFSWSTVLSLDGIANGFLLFGLPLMAILGIHESGHYLTSIRLGVSATPPYFIPFLPIPEFPLGTMGAVITMKSPMENRSFLVRIGAAGPLFGFIVAVVVIAVGLVTSFAAPMTMYDPNQTSLPIPILMYLMAPLFGHTWDLVLVVSPTLFAGWVGLFVTAMNLLPIGQLDGGHIFRAMFRRGSTVVYMLIIMLFGFMAFFVNPFYINFLFIIFIITMLGGIGHPPPLDDVTPIKPTDALIILASILVFFLSMPI